MINKISSNPHVDVFTSFNKAQETYFSLMIDGLTDADIEYICSIIIENIQRLRNLKSDG